MNISNIRVLNNTKDILPQLMFNHVFLNSQIQANGPFDIKANYYMRLKVYD
jgi:hypothetical protein